MHNFLSTNIIAYRFSCPHTSPQNGKAERLIHTTNDIVRTLLLQAHLPPPFWVEALHTATHLLNLRPSSSIAGYTPYYLLHGRHPSYDHLRVFGCLCYPNLYATSEHKLAPRSTRFVFLSYPLEHKAYRCYDLTTHRMIVSRHVTFDETIFPYEPNAPAVTPPLATANPTRQILPCAPAPDPTTPPSLDQPLPTNPDGTPPCTPIARRDPPDSPTSASAASTRRSLARSPRCGEPQISLDPHALPTQRI